MNLPLWLLIIMWIVDLYGLILIAIILIQWYTKWKYKKIEKLEKLFDDTPNGTSWPLNKRNKK